MILRSKDKSCQHREKNLRILFKTRSIGELVWDENFYKLYTKIIVSIDTEISFRLLVKTTVLTATLNRKDRISISKVCLFCYLAGVNYKSRNSK